MKVGFITNISSPYKTLQVEEFCKIDNIELTVYYTEPENKKIKWEEIDSAFKEIKLDQYNFLAKYNLILNKGIKEIIKKNDLILLSGYEQLSMIYASQLCKLYKKPYVILFDGISKFKLDKEGNKLKKFIKKIVINGSSYVMANGKVGRDYFEKGFNYPSDRIFNQYLSIDSKKIKLLSEKKGEYRKSYREKYNIDGNKKVLMYSGRLIEKKNVEIAIEAIAKLNKQDIVLFITGGGELKNNILELGNSLGVEIIITGFIDKQEELFKHYFMADALILPSKDEPWGLVVNEGMTAGLPVLVSDICGCSDDLVVDGENGYLINCLDKHDISSKIYKLLYENDAQQMGKKSEEIISEWTFVNSKNSLECIINNIK